VILYLDSSALVKLYVLEPATDTVEAMVTEADSIATSRIAYVEACAALARRKRERRLTQEAFAAAYKALCDQWRHFAAVELDELKAGALAVKHGLRGFDAVHLAAALEVRASAGAIPILFCSFDKTQATAARAENFSVVP
jgi:predicted nucleic acid-binding protein